MILVLAFWNFSHDNNESFDNDVRQRKHISVHEKCLHVLRRTMNSCPKQKPTLYALMHCEMFGQ